MKSNSSVEVKTWEAYWGSEAGYDVASDLECAYEQSYGESAVYWEPFNKNTEVVASCGLANRPDEYTTCGYTGKFEAWGIERCTKAIEAGCDNVDAVIAWIAANPK